MTLHDRIAEALGWSLKDVQSFSMQTLREFVRATNPKLVQEIDSHIRSGGYIFGVR